MPFRHPSISFLFSSRTALSLSLSFATAPHTRDAADISHSSAWALRAFHLARQQLESAAAGILLLPLYTLLYKQVYIRQKSCSAAARCLAWQDRTN